METYIILNAVFIGAALLWLLINKPALSYKKVLATVAILLVFTAVFDAVLIGLDIYTYDYSKTLNIKLGNVPVEDFFYAIMAGILVPAVWVVLGKKDKNETKD